MKLNEMVKSVGKTVVKGVKDVDKGKLLSIGGLVLGGLASVMSNASEQKKMDQAAEKAVQKLMNKDGGVQ